MVLEKRDGFKIDPDCTISSINEVASIQDIFKGSTVFITGATGFLGKLTLEKLIRTCPNIKKIYVIVREKKGKNVETRKKEMFDNEIFYGLKRKNIKLEEKIEILNGDLLQPRLGMTQEAIDKIKDVNFVFHLAATVRFDEKLRNATSINVQATRDLLKISKEMKHLKAFVYVSTAYSHCPREKIDEKFYDAPIKPQKLIDLVNALDDDKLAQITPIIKENWPNTYVFTKAVAEEFVKTESEGIPVVIVRPSIVLSTFKEPLAGWIDNFYGPTGIFMGGGLGLIRCLNGNPKKVADLVPADQVVNCIITSAWDTALNKEFSTTKTSNDPGDSIKIYNYVSGVEKPITWDQFKSLTYKNGMQIPSELCVWYYFFILTPSPWLSTILTFLLHTLPAYVVDFGAVCLRKKPRMVEGYKKINKFTEVIAYFGLREWKFSNQNTQNLYKKLNVADRKNFPFSMAEMDWEDYFFWYLRGARVYLLKDPMETLEKGRKWHRKLKMLHYATLTILTLIFLKILHVTFRFILSIIIGQ